MHAKGEMATGNQQRKPGRLQEFLKTPGDLAFLGALWLVGCLGIVTIVFSTAGLFGAVRARQESESAGLTRSFAQSIRTSWRSSTALSACIVPAAALEVLTLITLLGSGTAPALIAAGTLMALGVVACSLVLALHSVLSGHPDLHFRELLRHAFFRWLRRPGIYLAAVALGGTIMIVALQYFAVAAIFTASIPAWWILRSQVPPATGTGEVADEA